MLDRRRYFAHRCHHTRTHPLWRGWCALHLCPFERGITHNTNVSSSPTPPYQTIYYLSAKKHVLDTTTIEQFVTGFIRREYLCCSNSPPACGLFSHSSLSDPDPEPQYLMPQSQQCVNLCGSMHNYYNPHCNSCISVSLSVSSCFTGTFRKTCLGVHETMIALVPQTCWQSVEALSLAYNMLTCPSGSSLACIII